MTKRTYTNTVRGRGSFEPILVGDVVAESLDDVPMTVSRILGKGSIECQYFDSNDVLHTKDMNINDIIAIDTTW